MPLMTPITWSILIGIVFGAYGVLLLDRSSRRASRRHK
jgi:hypothetical protein